MSIHPHISGDATMTRTLAILAVGAALALTTTACTGAADKSAAGAPAARATAGSAPTATTATAAAPTASTTLVPAPTATTRGSTAGSTRKASQACPVSKATLLKAMKNDDDVTLGTPECYAGYALVEVLAKHPVADDEIATLKYESGAWKYLGGSTADFCAGMPAATVKHFEKNYPFGCGA
jgi:hypothetical protein